MKQKIFKIMISMLLIVTLIMANFLFSCVNFISYAIEEIEGDRNTNHKNVQFMVYFKDENKNKVINKDVTTNIDDLELYLQISVKREGYFNGNIILKNSNFKLKSDIVSDSISKIDDDTIYLNQINAGETKEIPVKIDILKDNQFDLNLIDIESEILIEGIYRDRTEKDISINAKRNVSLNFVSSYNNEDVVLEQDVMTNKIFEIDGERKRVVQIMVKSGVKDNLFPVNKTIINVQVPKISDISPEKVLVNSNYVLTTTGELLSQDNWNYDNKIGLISINIENKEKDGKVSWIKNGTDNLLITYIFDENIEIHENNLNVDSEIYLYDKEKTVLKSSNEIILDKEEKDLIVTSKIIQNETDIYKGKLNAGILRDISYKNIIDINLDNVIDVLKVQEDKQEISEQDFESVYKTSKINKGELDKILGENGSLEVINNGNLISTITKTTEADKDGNIVITYPENIEEIEFKIIEPDEIGKLVIETTKTIKSIDKKVVKKANSIVSKSSVIYISNSNEVKLSSVESVINLHEAETLVDLEINRDELSAMTSNDNVEFRITLNSREEKNELFKNPTLKLELPEKIESINVNSIDLLYEDEMQIKSAILNNKTIEITLTGEQTRYKEEAIDGAIILINANLQTTQKIANTTEQIKLEYTNNQISGSVTKNIDIVSYVGVVTTNQISEYGIDVVNNEGTEVAELAMSDTVKNVTISKKVINNKENKISDVKILGVFPTKQAFNINNIDIEVGNLSVTGIYANRFKVYYSDNENATQDLNDSNNRWIENIQNNKNVKKYLVVIDQLDLLEEINLEYQITIPADLEYNENAEEGYTVFYNNIAVQEQVNTKVIKLSTPKGTVLETTLKTIIAGQGSNKIKEYGILRYQINVANTGSENIENVVVKAKVPEGTKFVNTDAINNEVQMDELVFIDENKKEVEFIIDKLNSGEQVTKFYEVQINEGIAGNSIKNTVVTQYGEVTKNSNEVITEIEEGNLELKLVAVDALENTVKSGYQYRYVLFVTNKSNKDMKNVKATINTDDLINVLGMYYINSDDKAIMVEKTNNINIENIGKGETIEISINTKVNVFKDTVLKNTTILANVNYNDIEYNSNQIDLIAKSDLLFNLNVSSENSGGYVKSGDIIKYNVEIKNEGSSIANTLKLSNWISNDVTLVKVIKDGVELSEENYFLNIDNNKHQKVLELINEQLEPGKIVKYEIQAVVNLLYGNTEALEISSEYSLQYDATEIAKAKITHVLQPEENSYEQDDNIQNPDINTSNPDIDTEIEKEQYKTIYGVAWIDENENGQKDMDEKTLQGIKVKLLDVITNKFVKDVTGSILIATTTETGFYTFSQVKKGQYIVIFEYDNTKYGLTTFEKEGISNELNSNVITKILRENGVDIQVAATEIINVENDNISNINIGFINAKKYDLQLDKYISKVTVQNNKTVSNTYTDSTLVKQEIDAKQVNSTTVVVEYKIKVTNKGNVTGYVKKIADYLSPDYKFNSELNKNWYQSGNDVFCTSLANEPIEPGQSKEVTLVVIKEMTENNTGLINNMAEIVDSYNELGLVDINSVEGNRNNEENDMNSADLIISIKTGQVLMTISLIIVSIIILGIAVILLKRVIIDKKIF